MLGTARYPSYTEYEKEEVVFVRGGMSSGMDTDG